MCDRYLLYMRQNHSDIIVSVQYRLFNPDHVLNNGIYSNIYSILIHDTSNEISVIYQPNLILIPKINITLNLGY